MEKNPSRAFEDIKKVMAKQTILNCPNFNEVFDIHTDASDRQLGAQSHKMESHKYITAEN